MNQPSCSSAQPKSYKNGLNTQPEHSPAQLEQSPDPAPLSLDLAPRIAGHTTAKAQLLTMGARAGA